jgi:pimeloyl-ACP methyl ester carboxylesterase
MQPSMCEVYRRLHLHLIAPSIPGFGLSDSYPFGRTRRVSEWADTMRQLLARERIDHFFVAGTSFGCMHAASVAAAFPERVLGVALFTPTSPSEFDREIGAQLAAATAVSILLYVTQYTPHTAHHA